MNYEISNQIREVLDQAFEEKVGAKEFKTKGNDLQFKFRTKNGMNMVKIEIQENGLFMMKFYNYQPFRHIFTGKDTVMNVRLETLKEVFGYTIGTKI